MKEGRGLKVFLEQGVKSRKRRGLFPGAAWPVMCISLKGPWSEGFPAEQAGCYYEGLKGPPNPLEVFYPGNQRASIKGSAFLYPKER
ncbi:MAG: hypothetical protein LBB80_00475 [Treponema sp.]|jgi:hypothetical protein|nr:hypothetical protein [Treponema sp.]